MTNPASSSALFWLGLTLRIRREHGNLIAVENLCQKAMYSRQDSTQSEVMSVHGQQRISLVDTGRTETNVTFQVGVSLRGGVVKPN